MLAAIPKRDPDSSSSETHRLTSQSESLTDEELIAALLKGQAGAAIALYDQLCPAVDATLFRVFGERDAEFDDLVQNTFEQIVVTISNGRFGGKCSLRTWASVIAGNIAISAIRSRRGKVGNFESVQTAATHADTSLADEGLEERLEARSTLRRVQQALAAIDATHAQIILMHCVQGYPLKDVATVVGLTLQACQARLARGKKSFARAMGELEQRGAT